MRYCSECGASISLRVPEHDDRPRHVCDGCGTIHYRNPKLVIGAIPEWGGELLLCRRAIEPRRGLWTLPAGFMENGETLHEGAARETLEEANARVEIGPLYTVFNLPAIDQVYMLFRATLRDLDFSPGSESLETRLFGEEEIPWGDLAFQVVHETLRLYFADRGRGDFPTRVGTIERLPGRLRGYRTSMR
jgi:ADP-ribose pyrophosphatase YjhB (NUDIX family)